MLTAFDAGTAILLTCLVVIACRLPLLTSRLGQCLALGGGVILVGAARVIGGPAMGLDLSATLVLVWMGVGLGRLVIGRHAWPTHAMALALAVITATGAYLRAYRLDEVMRASDRSLQPDVEYYRQQALRTANPIAAGLKSPLWSALNAPIVRAMGATDTSIRVLSWCCGIAMLPLAGWGLGRLLHPLAGVLTAGMLAVQPYLIDLCTEGLREEAGVCLWMVILGLLLTGREQIWRASAAGVVGGALVLLRNTFLLPLIAMLVWALIYRRWSVLRLAALLVLPLLIAAPFYVNQYRAYGDPFALEKRYARYHANLEFRTAPPPGLSVPSTQEWRRDLYAGEPLSPLAYLLEHHSWSNFLFRQWVGTSRIVRGQPFGLLVEPWFGLAGTAAVIASLMVRRARFAGLFILSSSVGMTAHLMTVHPVELRLLLPVMVVWLGAAWWLIVSVAQAGLARTCQLPPRQTRAPVETRMSKPE